MVKIFKVVYVLSASFVLASALTDQAVLVEPNRLGDAPQPVVSPVQGQRTAQQWANSEAQFVKQNDIFCLYLY